MPNFGPWTVVEPWNGSPMLDVMAEGVDRPVVTVSNQKGPANEDDWEIARLIAASPKMFELLESTAIVLRQHGYDTGEIDAVLAEVKGE